MSDLPYQDEPENYEFTLKTERDFIKSLPDRWRARYKGFPAHYRFTFSNCNPHEIQTALDAADLMTISRREANLLANPALAKPAYDGRNRGWADLECSICETFPVPSVIEIKTYGNPVAQICPKCIDALQKLIRTFTPPTESPK
jgi:hypothetical protein